EARSEEIGDAVARVDRAVDIARQRLRGRLRSVEHGLARLPAVLLQEIGDAAHRVGGRAAEIDAPIAVEVDRVAPQTARHELRDADRTGIRAAQRECIWPRLA